MLLRYRLVSNLSILSAGTYLQQFFWFLLVFNIYSESDFIFDSKFWRNMGWNMWYNSERWKIQIFWQFKNSHTLVHIEKKNVPLIKASDTQPSYECWKYFFETTFQYRNWVTNSLLMAERALQHASDNGIMEAYLLCWSLIWTYVAWCLNFLWKYDGTQHFFYAWVLQYSRFLYMLFNWNIISSSLY